MSSPAWVNWMQSLMGGVSRHTYAATFPAAYYYCLLDELPIHLLPSSTKLRPMRAVPGSLLLNPNCTFSSGEAIPGSFLQKRHLLSRFALHGTIAWVSDPRRQCALPFWLSPALADELCALMPNQLPSPRLTAETIAALYVTGILLDADSAERERCEWENEIKAAAGLFLKSGYAPIHRLIHPFHIASLRRYYRYLIRSGALHLGDGQSSRRYVAHNEPVACFFHHQLVASVSAIVGKSVKPSYVYFSSYLSGAELRKHLDRAQCEYSITFCLDFSPEPALETPWPIRLDTANGSVTVHQAIGDSLVYRGTQLQHYRDVLGDGQTSTSLFFHFVDADFEGPLQ